MEQFWNDVKNFFTNAGLNILIGIVIIIVGLIVCRIVKRVLRRVLRKGRRDEAVISFVVSLTDIILKIIIMVSALATMGINTASIIAVLGTCGVSIGLALKDSLGNLASGIMIIFNKPFKTDDFVEVGGVSGKIVSINLFNTTLLTPDNKQVVLPNSLAVNNPLVNYDSCHIRRVDIPLSVPKGIELDYVKGIVGDIVEKDDRISETVPYSLRLTEQNADSVTLTLKIWCADNLYWDVLYDMNEKIYTAFTDKGIVRPNTQIDVRIKENE